MYIAAHCFAAPYKTTARKHYGMKRFIFTAITTMFFLTACHHKSTQEKKTYIRNTAINIHNAYNNLFLDSAALEKFITHKNVGENDADVLRSFYYHRNFEFAWFARYRITEQGRAFWNLASYNTTSFKDSIAFSKILSKRLPDITAEDTVWASAKDTFFVSTELMLTEAFIHYMAKQGKPLAAEQLEQYLPAKKQDVMEATLRQITSNEAAGLNNDAELAYKQLRKVLEKYYAIAKKGGWQTVGFTGKKLKKGVTDPAIAGIKNRLKITGEYDVNDNSPFYDTLLYTAVKKVQAAYGYIPDGTITDSLLKDLNVPVQKRVQQLLVNLNRLRWMPEAVKGRLITANIPEYTLHVFDNKTKVFDMDVVVGKQSSATVVFTGNLNEIVFSPYWNIPTSIIKKEIVPKMQEDTGYLLRQNMEIKGYKNGLPIVRQLPGANNSLGRVKFLFNNSYNIYFHDTPSKDLFSRRKRAFSHGCIRLSDPVKMAGYLLDNNKDWTPEKITAAMNSPIEIYAPLKHSVPVIITYYTAWASDNGELNLRDDIYGHDAETAEKMFTAAQ